MINNVMCAFDKKARCFLLPFYASHVDVAVRSFKEAANNPDHQVCKHPEDFALYHLGTFDDESATFALMATPVHVVEAIKVKKSEKL